MSDTRFDRLEAKIDTVKEDIGDIKSTLAAQHVSLKEHMRRTALIEAELKPIKSHVAAVSGAFKLIGAIAVMATILEGFSAFFSYLRGH